MKSKLFWGITFIILGAILLIETLDIFYFEIWAGFGTFWPVGLILIGFALVYKKKDIALALLLIMIVTGVLYLIDYSFHGGNYSQQYQELPYEEISDLTTHIEFGGGEIIISGDSDKLMDASINTTGNSPQLDYVSSGGKGVLALSRTSQPAFQMRSETWDINFNNEIPLTLNMEYGAAKVNMDLRGLKAKEVTIDSGATETEIIYGRYYTKTKISTGASKFNFRFPEGMGVIITIDGAAINTDFDGFRKEGNNYYSIYYDESKDNTLIEIDAGISEINGEFY